MAPETHEILGCFKLIDSRLHYTLVHFIYVSHIKYLMELDWSSWKLFSDFIECPHSHSSHLLGHNFELFVATPIFVNVTFQDLLVDVHLGFIETLVHNLSVNLCDKARVY